MAKIVKFIMCRKRKKCQLNALMLIDGILEIYCW